MYELKIIAREDEPIKNNIIRLTVIRIFVQSLLHYEFNKFLTFLSNDVIYDKWMIEQSSNIKFPKLGSKIWRLSVSCFPFSRFSSEMEIFGEGKP